MVNRFCKPKTLDTLDSVKWRLEAVERECFNSLTSCKERAKKLYLGGLSVMEQASQWIPIGGDLKGLKERVEKDWQNGGYDEAMTMLAIKHRDLIFFGGGPIMQLLFLTSYAIKDQYLHNMQYREWQDMEAPVSESLEEKYRKIVGEPGDEKTESERQNSSEPPKKRVKFDRDLDEHLTCEPGSGVRLLSQGLVQQMAAMKNQGKHRSVEI